MPDLCFFQNMHDYFMRVDGTVVGVYYLSGDGRDLIEGVFVSSQKHAREIIFDTKKWQAKKGVSFRKLEYMNDVGIILLETTEFQSGEDLPQLCFTSIQPKAGSGLVLPATISMKYELWMTTELKSFYLN